MSEVCVRVAVRVRPLLPKEVLHNHQVCMRVVPGSAQVMFGSDRLFSFDHAFGPTASRDEVYESCVQPLVESLLDGYNATVFCYGQTGSGKTYTLGGGNLVVVGAKEMVVTSAEELLSVLEMGNALRHTGTTGMNEHSSRSHAILTIQLSQCYHNNSVRSSKLCLVDLAGSERAGKTGNTGTRLKESVHINTGLLALGNVIRALSDPGRNRRGNNCNSAHIPYRDAKITRILRDSLGGTAHTLMVACVSPSHHNVAETLSVLQFASKARHIRNRPRAESCHAEVKSCPTMWDPSEARLGELEYEVQTLRELLKEKEIEMQMEREKTGGRVRGEDSFIQSSQTQISEPDKKVNQEELSQYRLLVQEAAALFADICGPTPSHSFRQLLQDWQERLKAVSHSQKTDDQDCSEEKAHHVTILQLRQELKKCQEALIIEKQLLEQKDAEMSQAEKEVEKLLQERKSHLQALEEEKERTRIQTEQLVNQQILTDRLRSDLMTFRHATSGATVESGASGNSGKRPHSVPLIRHSCGHRPPRKTKREKEDDDNFVGRMGFRRSLNRTWTSRQKKASLKEENTELDQTSNGIPPVQEAQRATEQHAKRCHVRKERQSVSVTHRKIQELSVNMRMKEELIKELDKTDKETQEVGRHGRHSSDGREAGVLARLSMQSQQFRTELYRSLQHMRVQRAQLQTSLRQERETSDKNKEFDHDEARDSCWLEEVEEQVLQRRAELQELEEELRRREEVLLHREACLQQKNKLEIRRLRSSQVLSQELLHVSVRLESLEEQLQSRQTGGVTMEELQKERDMLKKKRDTLDAQLKDNRVFTMEEEHSLLQLEEAIEALDAALEFKNYSIQNKQTKLSITDSPSCQSQSTEPAHLCSVINKLKQLSPPEASELLVKYFNKVICLRDAERHLRLRCEELELHAGEQEVVLKEMEAAMQRLALDADRRLTQQHRDHQNNIQLLLQKLKEGGSGDTQQAIRDRIQNLEKELFYYKSSSRQLKKKLKELLGDALHTADQSSHTQEHTQTHRTQIHTTKNKPQMQNEEVQSRTHITTTYTKIHAEPKHNNAHLERRAHQTSSDLHAYNKTKMEMNERGAAQCGDSLEMTPVRLCRKELRQISPADLQVCDSATRRRQSVVATSTESILEDSIELPRTTER
ncbi:hypothetical protein PAMP_022691 [Pampus punctatissimus]